MLCGAEDGTIVAAHANWSDFGKGMSHKASDAAIAFLCFHCHSQIDQGSKLSKEARRAFWMEAAVKTWVWLIETGKVVLA
jgi:hypothetical protein